MLNKICRLVELILVCCLFVSCEEENEQSADYDVLVIGNSYARDAFSYVPCLVASVNPEVSINVSILGENRANLEQIYSDISKGNNSFLYDKYLFSKGKWKSVNSKKGKSVITSKKWNLIILQENSVTATDYDKTRKNVSKMVSFLRKKNKDVPIAFMLNPTHPMGSKLLDSIGVDSDTEFYLLAENAKKLLDGGVVDYVIPCGTAIQNARQTALNDYGDFGQLSYDGNHLQEGLPCLIEAYTASQFLLNYFSISGSIENSDLVITDKWVKNKKIPGQHGNVVTGTLSDYRLSKKCARAAICNLYTITLVE
ncbi:MAG: DUF4886 domain-containing protein [Paludibacteraceae bacterium]|nr:DUF4886 domain-containing protein [Paludibacteraceae bacterium]